MASIAPAIAAGLFVGIALVVAFYILDASPSFQSKYAHKDISYVTIPSGASTQNSSKNFEPASLTVMIGKNNTVVWVNKDIAAVTIKADNNTTDPDFYAATTTNATALQPNQTFEFVFTRPGTFGYHSEPHPWLRGTITVLPLR
jgi:plastocyanin